RAGVLQPAQVAHMRYKGGRTSADYVGERGRERLGSRKWRKKVCDVIEQLKFAFEADYVVLGGGNAVRLKRLPRGVRLGDTRNAFIGGLRLWQPGHGPLRLRGGGAAVRRLARRRELPGWLRPGAAAAREWSAAAVVT